MMSEDEIIDTLLQDIDYFEKEKMITISKQLKREEHFPSNPEWAVGMNSEPRIVYVKKRKYTWRNMDYVKQRKKNRLDFCRFQRYVFPKIVKRDIRRQYSLMYANVMNSYDYHLVSSFFRQFMIPSVCFEKKSAVGMFPPQIISGLDLVMKLFFLILQGSVDKTTRVSDITIKQFSLDKKRSEVTCKCIVDKNALYDLSSMRQENSISTLFQGTPNLLLPPSGQRFTISTPDMTKLHGNSEDLAKSMFDPVQGEFVRNHFPRITTPQAFRLEGYLTFVVNEDRWIESIIADMKKVSYTPNSYNIFSS